MSVLEGLVVGRSAIELYLGLGLVLGEEVDDGVVALRRRDPQGRGRAFGLGIGLGAVLEQKRAHVVVALRAGDEERRQARLGGVVDLSTGVDEHGAYLPAPSLGGHTERCEQRVRFADLHLRSLIQQMSHHFGVVLEAGHPQRRHTVLASKVNVGSLVDKRHHNIAVSRLGSTEYGRHSQLLVPSIHLGFFAVRVGHEQLAHVTVSILSRDVERAHAILSRGVHRGVGLQQHRHNVTMPVLGSHVEWAHALGIPRVHFDPLLKEVADDFGEAVLAGNEEGRGAVLRYAVGVGTLLQQVVDGLLLVVITGYIQRRDIVDIYSIHIGAVLDQQVEHRDLAVARGPMDWRHLRIKCLDVDVGQLGLADEVAHHVLVALLDGDAHGVEPVVGRNDLVSHQGAGHLHVPVLDGLEQGRLAELVAHGAVVQEGVALVPVDEDRLRALSRQGLLHHCVHDHVQSLRYRPLEALLDGGEAVAERTQLAHVLLECVAPCLVALTRPAEVPIVHRLPRLALVFNAVGAPPEAYEVLEE